MRVNRDLQVHKILAERIRAKVSRNPFMTPLQVKEITANDTTNSGLGEYNINEFNSVTGTNVGVKTVYIDTFFVPFGVGQRSFGLVYLNPHIMVKPGSGLGFPRLAVNLNIQVEAANGRLYSVRYNAGDEIDAGTVLTTNPGLVPNVDQRIVPLQGTAPNPSLLDVFIENGQVQLGLTTPVLLGQSVQRARVSIEVLEA
jgi:hypothetical protein